MVDGIAQQHQAKARELWAILEVIQCEREVLAARVRALNGDFQHPSVQEASQRLDELVIDYYRVAGVSR